MLEQHNILIMESHQGIKGNTVKIDIIQKDIRPIVEGVHSIEESVKVLRWVSAGAKWVASIGAVFYIGYEYVHEFFKS